VIGLTGNIAVGKSIVLKMLQHLGAYTIDADSLAHQTMLPNAPAYKPVVDTFGKMIVGADGRIDRAALGRIVFANPEAMQKLEAITHPIIRQGMNALISRAQQRVVVIEAIKLVEGGLADMVDSVWVVDAKPQTQYKRLVLQRKMSEADAKQRILAQGQQAEKLKRANVVINNDGDMEATWKQVQTQWQEIRRQLTGGQPAAPAPTKPAAPAVAKPAAPTAAKPAPTPAAPPAAKPTPPPAPIVDDLPDMETRTVDVSGITVKRGMPGNAQVIADFIKATSGKEVTRTDVMMSFGQKSFLIAQDTSGKPIGLMGWTVENLVTRMDEFYLGRGIHADVVVHAMVIAIEEASKELQSEVAFFFLLTDTPEPTIKAYAADGYAPITLKEIKVPAWREAVEEAISSGPMQVLWKQLRKDRVLQPI
jgi:dephospho-CoA kinase